jgi:serine/threonine-protein kinase
VTELLGKTIGQFQIVEFTGESEDTLVYKGFQPSTNRYVMVKALKPSAMRDQARVDQFLQQAELVAQIQHPNILPVYDSGREEDVVYQVSQYIEKGTLGEHLYEFSDPRKALNLMAGISEGLDAIHALGYVHGSLMPSNIYLDDGNRPLLTDFGFPQQAGRPITPYLSPEQVQGGVVDRRSDIYAMGVLLYEMLVGETPPAGVVVSARAKRPDLPEAVDRVILKAMAQNPDQRFQTAVEFRDALDAALRPVAPPAQPTQAQYQQPAPAPAPAPAKKGTNWVAVILGGILIVVLCIAAYQIVPGLIGDQETPTEEPPVEATAPPAPTEPPLEPTQPPEVQPTQPPGETPEIEQPIELPEGGGGILDDLCGSIGFIGGAVIFAGVLRFRRRQT